MVATTIVAIPTYVLATSDFSGAFDVATATPVTFFVHAAARSERLNPVDAEGERTAPVFLAVSGPTDEDRCR